MALETENKNIHLGDSKPNRPDGEGASKGQGW